MSLKEKNPDMERWDWAYSHYQRLEDWKKNDFDKRMENNILKDIIQDTLKKRMTVNVNNLLQKKKKSSSAVEKLDELNKNDDIQKQMLNLHSSIMDNIKEKANNKHMNSL